MCGHVLLVFVVGRLAWATNVPHLRTPAIESRLSVLHALVVMPRGTSLRLGEGLLAVRHVQ